MLSIIKSILNKNKKPTRVCKNDSKAENAVITKSVDNNVNCLKEYLGNSFDLKDRKFKLGGTDTSVSILFIDNLVDEPIIQAHIIEPLMLPVKAGHKTGLKEIKDFHLPGKSLKEARHISEILSGILSGETFLSIEGSDTGILIDTNKFKGRDITEPTSEPSVKGSKEAFVEILKDNIGLIRRRLKDPNLRFEVLNIGKHTQCKVVITHLEGVANKAVVNEARKRILSTETDDVAGVRQLGNLISDNPRSIFPLVNETERPDKVVAAILEGKVGIIIENSSGVLLVPVTLINFLNSTDDYFEKWVISSALRLIRYSALLISTLLPATYIAITSFHPGMLPTDLALSIAGSRAGVPFPAFFEALIMIFTLELLQEAGIRLPKVVGQTVSIVGGLVIGQSAVQAGIISPIMVIIISITAISSFAVTNYSLGFVTRILRIPFMILAAFLGAFGISMGIIYLIGYMCSLQSYGVYYMEPLTPYRLKDWRDAFIITAGASSKNRPEYLSPENNSMNTSKGGHSGEK